MKAHPQCLRAQAILTKVATILTACGDWWGAKWLKNLHFAVQASMACCNKTASNAGQKALEARKEKRKESTRGRAQDRLNTVVATVIDTASPHPAVCTCNVFVPWRDCIEWCLALLALSWFAIGTRWMRLIGQGGKSDLSSWFSAGSGFGRTPNDQISRADADKIVVVLKRRPQPAETEGQSRLL